MKSLGKKILKIMEAVERVKKDKRNEFHKYDYVSDEAIVSTLRGEIIKNGLAILPSHEQCAATGDLTTLLVSYTVVDTETGENFVSKVYGYGQDKGDKGVYKAATGAEKYFLLKTFLIPTGDDPENENGRQTEHRSAPKETPRATAPNGYEPIGGIQTVTIKPTEVKAFKNKKPNKDGIFGYNYRIMDQDGTLYRTFDGPTAEIAKDAARTNKSMTCEIEVNEYGNNIKRLITDADFIDPNQEALVGYGLADEE